MHEPTPKSPPNAASANAAGASPSNAGQAAGVVAGDSLDSDLPYGLHHVGEGMNYYAWQASTFARHVRGKVLEHGAGSGALSAALLDHGIRELVLSEPTPQLVRVLRRQFDGRAGAEVFAGTLEEYLAKEGPGSIDGIVSSNVLEHIVDDLACLRAMRDVLRPGGRVAIYVPARPELFGPYDTAVGHQRRYRKQELANKLRQSGFDIDKIEYRNIVGAAGWFVNQRLLKKRDLGSGNVWVYDKIVFPIMSRIEDVTAPPYGLNLLALAHKSS